MEELLKMLEEVKKIGGEILEELKKRKRGVEKNPPVNLAGVRGCHGCRANTPP